MNNLSTIIASVLILKFYFPRVYPSPTVKHAFIVRLIYHNNKIYQNIESTYYHEFPPNNTDETDTSFSPKENVIKLRTCIYTNFIETFDSIFLLGFHWLYRHNVYKVHYRKDHKETYLEIWPFLQSYQDKSWE